MMNRARRQITNTPETPIVLADVNEPGVYYKDSKGRWTLMETEIVHEKSGGFRQVEADERNHSRKTATGSSTGASPSCCCRGRLSS